MTLAQADVILAINPGSVSTKLALSIGGNPAVAESVDHTGESWSVTHKTVAQLPFRVSVVREFLARHGFKVSDLSCVVARGGLLRPVASGTYPINRAMVEDSLSEVGGRHVSNLGPLLAWELSEQGRVPAFIVDPVSVDEFSDDARVSGHPGLPRKSLLHALNMKASARRAASDLGMPLEDLFLVIAHLGSGFSVSPCYEGHLRDVNNSNEEGPFTIERAGTLPSALLWDLHRKSTDLASAKISLSTESGMYGHLGTKDARAVEERASADERARSVYEGMAYQVAKEIGAMASAFPAKVDAIVITGGLARSATITRLLRERTAFIAPHLVYPGEDEMASLTAGARRVLLGEEGARVYPGGEVTGVGNPV
jgi:butyrate kinase